MNLPTIVLSIFLVLLFALAIRHLLKKGTCSGCSEKSSCPAAGCEHCSGCHKTEG